MYFMINCIDLLFTYNKIIITVYCKYVLGCNALNLLILYLACYMQASKSSKNVYDLLNIYNRVSLGTGSKLWLKRNGNKTTLNNYNWIYKTNGR